MGTMPKGLAAYRAAHPAKGVAAKGSVKPPVKKKVSKKKK